MVPPMVSSRLPYISRRTMARLPNVARYIAQIGAMSARATMNAQATEAASRSLEKLGGFSSW